MWFDKNRRLRKAVKQSCAADVAFLVDSGADVNAASLFGFSPLFLAVRIGDVEIVNILIANGRKIESACALLEHAASPAVVESLINAGV